MSIDRIVLAFAGVMIIATVLLGMYHHSNWHWFTVFIGANLLQSAITGFCPLALILKKVGTKPGAAFN
ncbi:MAG: YgaP family membrane protein [Gammaproteobacteria bacterium]